MDHRIGRRTPREDASNLAGDLAERVELVLDDLRAAEEDLARGAWKTGLRGARRAAERLAELGDSAPETYRRIVLTSRSDPSDLEISEEVAEAAEVR